MFSMNRFAALSGITLCLSAVAFGAFGAHALEPVLHTNGQSGTFELANRYHFYHGLALLAIGSSVVKISRASVLLLLLGICVFSGSLYALSLSGMSLLGAITPIGGLMLIMGWVKAFLDVLSTNNS